MEVSSKKITSSLFAFLFIFSNFSQGFPYVSSNSVNYVPEVKNFCMPKGEATDAQLQANLDWVCTNQGVDCGPIQVGGPCFKPNTVRAHAGWAMNAYYHLKDRNLWNCDFRGTGTIVHVDQSNGDCQYAF